MLSRKYWIAPVAGLLFASLGARAETKATPAPAGERALSQAQGLVAPIVVGIEGADLASKALNHLSSSDSFYWEDSRALADMAAADINSARGHTEKLRKIKGLSAASDQGTKDALLKLEDARKTVDRIKRDVGKFEHTKDHLIGKTEADMVAKASVQLHNELLQAKDSIEEAATAEGLSTEFEMPETVPVRGTEEETE